MKPRSPVLLMGLLSCLFGCGNDHPYTQKDGTWYFKKVAMSLEKGESLTPINKKFAKSNRTAYFESSMIASDVDVATFEPLSDHYAKDNKNVWYCDTYRDGKEYFTVKRYRTPRIVGADAPSFRMLNNYYARDTTWVYSDGVGFKVRDINTYERIGDMHARDKVSGYYLRAEIPGSDGPTFNFITSSYAKDAKHVYWSKFDTDAGTHPAIERTVTLPDADPATFVMLESSYAHDAGQVYYEARVLSKSPATFRVLERDYAVSDSSVYYRGEVLKGADRASFVVLPIGDGPTAQDKLGTFNYEKRVQQ
ncbi:MAG: DKNYY domain-containing protein [Gemmatimonadaceae bacterium]